MTSLRRLIVFSAALMALAMTSCHSNKKMHSSPGHPRVEEIHVSKPTTTQARIIDEAYTWLGTPYKYAGVEKGEGVDCSGMVMKVYETAAGMKLPRNSAKQAEFCTEMDASDIDVGDLVFFAEKIRQKFHTWE